MIRFIINDNDKEFSKKIGKSINQYMFHNNLEYQILNYPILDIANKVDFKERENIFIFDTSNCIDFAIHTSNQIRKKDLKSPIIFVAYDYKNLEKVMKNTLLLFSFITKYEFEEVFQNTLRQALKYIDVQDVLCVKQNRINYRISKNNILYIMTNPGRIGSIIVTDDITYKTRQPLIKLKEQLDDSFVQSHRSCIVNRNRVLSIDLKNRILEFDNGEKIDLVSYRLKSSLKDIL